LIAVGCLAFTDPLSGEPAGIVQRELQRRAENTQKAQQALIAGDKAYRLANYAEAVREFSTAHELLPGGSRTGELKAAAAERLAQAAVEQARHLARTGDVEQADSLLESVLAHDIAPNYAPAEQMREQIHDPIRFNPALSPKHVRKIDEVRRLLYEAHGFNDLAQFDRAITMFEEVLRIDPHNTAARRGIEAATNHKRHYFSSARDEARASMLTDVVAAWASPVPKPILNLDTDVGALRDDPLFGGASASEKLASLVVPVIDMDEVGLFEAIDFLRAQSRNLDAFEPNPARKGITFVIELGTGDPARTQKIESIRFNLKLRNIPLQQVLDYINNATGTTSRVDDHAVVIRPAGAVSDDLILRQFLVPPDFLSRDALPGGGGDVDPFGAEEPTNRRLVKRLSALEYLKQKGVSFPPGSSANFSPSTSVLGVRNTQTNMALVEAIIESIVDAEPVMIIVEARIIRSSQKRLEELGFDWLLGASKITNEVYLGGGSVGNGTQFSSSALLRPLTSGLRSGNLATESNSIDAAIARTPLANATLRAPGSVTAFGLINNEIVATLMRGVSQNTGIDLMTKKSVITRSGQTASIHSVREFIYPTEYEPPELPNSVGAVATVDPVTGLLVASSQSTIATPATPTAFETTNLGCMMEVLPQLRENGKIIEVSIKPEIRQFDGFIEYGTPITGGTSSTNFGLLGGTTTSNFGIITQNSIVMPVISTLRGNTVLTIADGATVVLGGLMRSSRVKVEDAVPILSKIPFLGRLFESQSETLIRDAYIILVTVRLQDPSGQPVNR